MVSVTLFSFIELNLLLRKDLGGVMRRAEFMCINNISGVEIGNFSTCPETSKWP